MRTHITGLTLMSAGVVSIVVGFLRVCGSLTLAEMLASILLTGIGGVVLLSCGAVMRLSAHLRAEWQTIEAVQALVVSKRDTNGSKRFF